MKLLLIGPIPPPLGGATVLFDQLLKSISVKPGVTVSVIDTSRKGRAGVFSNLVGAVQGMQRLLMNIRQTDVVSFHASIRGIILFAPIVWFVCRIFAKPFVCRGFGGFYPTWHKNASFWARTIFDWMTLRADVVLFETQATIEYFRSISHGNLVWFPNARPLRTAEEPTHHIRQSGATRFVYIGHVIPGKGIHQLIEAAQKLPGEFTIDVYGPLKDGINETHFSGTRTKYRGIVKPEAVIDTIKQYDVLLLPTYLETEGYPGVILEAYSAGVPVIACKIGAIPEIVDRSSGILIEPRSVQGLCDAMTTLMTSPKAMRELETGAKAMAHKFSSEAWADHFIAVCRSLYQTKSQFSRTP